MPSDNKERQLAALRKMLDGIYLDATQSHSTGTVPCDLTIIFTALASLTVNNQDVKDDVCSLKTDLKDVLTDVKNLGTQLQTIAAEIKIRDASSQARKNVWTGIIGFLTGSLGLIMGRWIYIHWNDLMGLM